MQGNELKSGLKGCRNYALEHGLSTGGERLKFEDQAFDEDLGCSQTFKDVRSCQMA